MSFQPGRRPSSDSRPLVEETPRVDLRPLLSAANRSGDGRFEGMAIVSGGVSDEVVAVAVDLGRGVVDLDGRPITLHSILIPASGGLRWRACCPRCDRRCELLYIFGSEEPSWCCQACSQLAHRSEHTSKRDRLLWRARRIRVRVGGPDFDTVLGPFPPRPPRMRHATYARLREDAEAALDEYVTTGGTVA